MYDAIELYGITFDIGNHSPGNMKLHGLYNTNALLWIEIRSTTSGPLFHDKFNPLIVRILAQVGTFL